VCVCVCACTRVCVWGTIMHEELSWELTLLSSYLRAICSTFSWKTSSSPFPFWTSQSSFSCYPWTTFCSRRTGIASKTAGTLRTLMVQGENDSEIISKTSSRSASLKYFCWCPCNKIKSVRNLMDGGKVCMHMQSQWHTRFGSGPLPSLQAAQGFQDFLLNLVVPRSITRWKTVQLNC